MSKIRCLLLCLAFAGAGMPLRGQTLEECRKLAREHYPEIRQYGLIERSEKYDLSNAARAWIPQVVMSAQATWQSDVVEYPEALSNILAMQGMDIPGMRKDQYKVALDISQTLWDGGQSRAGRALSSAEAEEARAGVDVDLYGLESRVDNLYFGILLLEGKAAQTEAVIALLESNLERMRSFCRNGIAMQADADAVEAELLTTRQSLAQIESSEECYRRMLALFIGRPLESGRLVKPEYADVAERTSARPELSLFKAGAAKAEAQRMSLKTSLSPRFSAFAQGYYGYPGLDMFKSMMSSSWRLNAVVGVRMSWNIGAFYTYRNNIGKIDAAQRKIDLQQDIFLFNSQMQTEQDDGEIARLRQALSDDERIVELRRSVRMAAESQLENGEIDSTALLRKITDEASAELSRRTHEIELLKAIYSLKHTLNQ